jgi:hypothetical protein
MIDNIIDHDRIVNHHRLQHCDAFSFFYGHRRYILCVEKLLAKKALPLPIWNPQVHQKIPRVLQGVKYSSHACLSSTLCTHGWFDIPFDHTEINVDLPIALTLDNICKQDFYSLHKEAVNYHGLVHNAIGGTFISFDSAAAPIFYTFHNYIDKQILKVWEQCSNENLLFHKKYVYEN